MMTGMLDNKHLHISDADAITDWLSKALASAKSGRITINIADKPAATIDAETRGQILVDLLQPTIFRIPEDDTGLFDKMKTASEFGQQLSENGVTICFLRKGKEAIRLGKDAKPTLSKLITRSDDIQMSSVRELTKLKNDFKTE